MADNLTVKLGADTSEFRGQIASAAQSVGSSLGTGAGDITGNRFVSAFEHRIFGMRHLTGALATALGLNFDEIAKNIARVVTGVSKEEEENLKRLGDLSEKLADATKRNMQDKLSDEDLYKAKVIELGQLQNQLANNQAKTTKEQADAEQTQIDIQNKEVEIRKLGNSLRTKQFEEDLKWYHRIEEIKKQDDEAEKERMKKMAEEDVSWYKKQYHQEQELHELKLQALPPEQRLIELGKDRLVIEQKIAKEKRNGEDTLADEIKLAKLDAQIRSDTLLVEKDITNEIKDQNKEKMNASGDLGVARSIGGFATYKDPAQQQAYEKQLLESAKRDTDQEIASLQSQIDAYMTSGSALGKYEIPALRDRLNALKGRENHLQDFVFNPHYKDAAGSGLFAQQVQTIGDPLKLLGEQVDALNQVASGVTDLNTRLHAAGFGTGK